MWLLEVAFFLQSCCNRFRVLFYISIPKVVYGMTCSAFNTERRSKLNDWKPETDRFKVQQ